MLFNLLQTEKPLVKRDFDTLVDSGHLSRVKHPKLPLYLYCYTKRVKSENNWNDITKNARGIVFNKDGKLISKSIPKIFSYNEKKVVIPKTFFTVHEMIDGVGISSFWYDNQLVVHTKNEFENEYVDFSYVNRGLFLVGGSIKTISCELVMPGASYTVKRDPGFYLTAAYDHKFRSIDLLDFRDWKGFRPKNHYQLATLRQSLAKVINASKTYKNIKGWVLTFDDKGLTKVKVKSEWFMKNQGKTGKINALIKEGIYEGLSLDEILDLVDDDLKPYVRNKVEEFKSIVSDKLYTIGISFMDVYDPNIEKFTKNIESYPRNWKKYLHCQYRNENCELAIMEDAFNLVFRDV